MSAAALSKGEDDMKEIMRAAVAFCFLVSPANAGTREIAQELFKFATVCGVGYPTFSMANPSPTIAQTAFRYEAGMLGVTVSGFRSYADKNASCTVTMYASPQNFGRVAFYAAICVANAQRSGSVEAAIKPDINDFYSRVIELIDFGIKHSECLC
jgi:hypothetical protein